MAEKDKRKTVFADNRSKLLKQVENLAQLEMEIRQTEGQSESGTEISDKDQIILAVDYVRRVLDRD